MQTLLDLGFGASLDDIRRRLRMAYGQFGEDRRVDPLSQLIKSCISARTRDEVSLVAYLRLRRAFPAWSRLAEVPVEDIESLIGEVTHARDKAERLGLMVRTILSRTGALRLDFLADLPIEEAVDWLQGLPGVGRHAACAALCFSTLMRPVMVVDTHAWRVARRLGIAPATGTADAASMAITAAAPASWTASDFREFHWLLKALGRAACQHDVIRCGGCPLRDACPSAKTHLRPVSL